MRDSTGPVTISLPGHDRTVSRLTRRAVLASAIPTALLSDPVFGQGASIGASVATSAATSVAGAVGRGLASGAVSAVGAVAVGQLMAAVGVDMSGQGGGNGKLDEVLAKLGLILDQMVKLQGAVERLRGEMERSFSSLIRDVSLGTVIELININANLLEDFQALRGARPAEIAATVRRFRSKFADSLERGLETWNNALLGLSGQTSILQASSNVIVARSGALYGPADAKKMQNRWDYLDAQQALTAMFLVERLNAMGRPERAKAALRKWAENRKAQVARVYGGVRSVEDMVTLDAGGQRVSVRMTSPALPAHTLIQKRPVELGAFKGKLPMWYLTVGAPVPHHTVRCARVGMLGCETPEWPAEVLRAAAAANQQTGPHHYPFDSWRVIDEQGMTNLMVDCGLPESDNKLGAVKQFRDVLARNGFTLPPGQLRLWTHLTLGGEEGSGRIVMRDGDRSDADRNPNATASLLLVRLMEKNEEYWYPPA